jgi:hypothetical protein
MVNLAFELPFISQYAEFSASRFSFRSSRIQEDRMTCLVSEYNVKTGNVRSALVIAGQDRAPLQ